MVIDSITLASIRGNLELSMDVLESNIKDHYKSFNKDRVVPLNKEGFAYGFTWAQTLCNIRAFRVMMPKINKDIQKTDEDTIREEALKVFDKRINHIVDSLTDL